MCAPIHAGGVVLGSLRAFIFAMACAVCVCLSVCARSHALLCQGLGVCPSETFVWRDLTVQEHMLVLGR